jgi:hypothetical protein
MNVFEGVKLAQLLEAFYDQGRKDGKAEVAAALSDFQKTLGPGRPGRPKKAI